MKNPHKFAAAVVSLTVIVAGAVAIGALTADTHQRPASESVIATVAEVEQPSVPASLLKPKPVPEVWVEWDYRHHTWQATAHAKDWVLSGDSTSIYCNWRYAVADDHRMHNVFFSADIAIDADGAGSTGITTQQWGYRLRDPEAVELECTDFSDPLSREVKNFLDRDNLTDTRLNRAGAEPAFRDFR